MGAGEDFEALLGFLRDNRGFDFTGYKRASLQRRIDRRMQQVGVGSYEEYVDYLQFHAEEFTALFNTILINVTSFFRDPDSWEHLRTDVLPELMAGKRDTETVRVWSAGTASGEEAYSAAMVLTELLGPDEFRDRVKIYATDIDEEALAQARLGVYTDRQVAAVPEELRARYFEAAGERFAFRKDLRRCLIFGRNDLIQDAPISRVDLLICRNTLMYFSADTQDLALRRFHFALTPGGVLFLGKAEMLLSQSRLYRPLDARRRMFQKVPGELDAAHPMRVRRAAAGSGEGVSLAQLALESIPQAAFVVSAAGALEQANPMARDLLGLGDGDIGRAFRELEGASRLVDLPRVIDRVRQDGAAITQSDVQWRRGDETRHLEVTVAPLPPAADGSVVVFFQDVTATYQLESDLGYANRQLENSYEELQSTVEELETTNEELQSTVEELETTNEELQSTNEELETTNEELQSTNDELQAANEELNERGAQVNAANAFMGSILRSIEAAVVVVGTDFTVRAWSDQADEMWGVRPDEAIGQHLMNLDIGLSLDVVYPALRRILSGSSGQERLRTDAVNRRGKPITVEVACRPVKETSGELTGCIIFIQEVEAAGESAGGGLVS